MSDKKTKSPAETKPTKSAKSKSPKMVKAKKLPALLKKSYSEEKLTKKILNKIYVVQEKTFVRGFFVEDAGNRLAIPKDAEIPKSDFARLKKIAKEIKRQKFGVKLVPLAAVVGGVVALCLVVGAFKNVIIKRAIVSGMQGIFKAKTDIAYLDFDIFGAKLEIRGLEQANKDDVMKNIFEVGEITLDFNLTELLRGKFDAENLTVADVLLGTERTTSGYIPVKESDEEKGNSEFIANMQKTLVADVQKTLVETFAAYNPANIIENVQNNLRSPAMAETARATVEPLIDKWKDEPARMESSIRTFAESAQEIVNTDWANITNPVVLAQALTNVNNIISQGQTIKTETERIVAEFKSDTESIANLSRDVAAAIASDMSLVDTEIDKFRELGAMGVSGIFNKTLNAFMYNLLGAYYPYVQKGIDVAAQLKSRVPAKGGEKKAEKAKRTARRMAGRDVYWKQDKVPRFLIEKAFGSGANWSVSASDISSDMDKRGEPAKLAADFAIDKITNSLNAVIDGRSDTDARLVTANYGGSGFPLSLAIDDEWTLSSPSSVISCGISGDSDGSFGLNGSLDLSGMKIATPSFEPAAVYAIYERALDQFNAVKVGFDVDYAAAAQNMNLTIDTDAGTQFARIFQNLLSSELQAISASVRKQVSALLAEKTGGINEQIVQLTGIQNAIDLQQLQFTNLDAQLVNVQQKIMQQIAEKTGVNALPLPMPSGDESLQDAVENAANKAAEDAAQRATDALRGLFGR